MWWQDEALLTRYVSDFLKDALSRRSILSLHGAADALVERPAEFGFSSLDFIDLASRFSHCTGIDRTGLGDLLLARRSAADWAAIASRSLAIDHSSICFYSSGSTATPHPTPHHISNLLREVDTFRAMFPASRRWVATVPSHHIYGFLWTVLMPSRCGAPVMALDSSSILPTRWGDYLQEDDLLVSTPDIWELLLRNSVRLPASFTGISSTAPMPPELHQALLDRYPLATFVDVYGSTETGAIAWRHRPEEAWRPMPYWSLNIDCSGITDRDSGISLPIPDRVLPTDDGRFILQGRNDGMVQIAGHNVDLQRVREMLLSYCGGGPAISDAQVRVTGEGAGSGLKFFLQLEEEPRALASWCILFNEWLMTQPGNIPPAQSVVIAGSLPRSTLQKPIDWDPLDYAPVIAHFRHGYA